MVQGKRWRFTCHSCTEEELSRACDAVRVVKGRLYVIIGLQWEVNHPIHIRGYITFETNQRFGAVNGIFKDISQDAQWEWEITTGSTDENIKYCSNGQDSYFEVGEVPKRGKRKGEEQ